MWPFNRLSIFWKVFIWFWLSTLTIVLVSLFLWYQYRDSISFHKSEPVIEHVLDKVVKVLESDHRFKKKKRMIKHLLYPFNAYKKIDRHLIINEKNNRDSSQKVKMLYLIDDEGKNFYGKSDNIPKALIALHQQKFTNQMVMSAFHQGIIFSGPRKVYFQEKVYNLYITSYIGAFPVKAFFAHLSDVKLEQLASALLISIIFCLLLSWTVVSPVRKLQSVMKRLAKNDVVSAVSVLGKRRDEFYDLGKDLDAMFLKITKILDAQKQLMSDVSHELRSPLARLQMSTGILEKKIDVQHKKDIERIELECQRLNEMIGQLLDISALERGKIFEEISEFSINKLLEDLVNDILFEAQFKNIQVECHLTKSELMFSGYFNLLRSACENILRNAIRHTQENSEINLSLQMIDNDIVITVEDEGDGVPEEELDKIFNPFYRADEARTRTKGGTGLGLTIAQRAVTANGGTIQANNRSEKGLRVDIRLPLKVQ